MLGEWWGDCCPVSSLGLLRREGAAELGIFPSEWLRRPLPPSEEQGTEKSHHFFGLCGGSACGVEGRAERALSRECHLSKRDRVGLAGSSGRKVTVRPRSPQKGEWEWSQCSAEGDGVVPHSLPGTLGKAKPPEVASKSRRRVPSQHWEKGEEALLPRQGPGLAYCRTPTFLLLPP